MKKLSQLFSITSLLLLVNIVINHNNNIKQRADTNTSLILTNNNLSNIIHGERRQLDEETKHIILTTIAEMKSIANQTITENALLRREMNQEKDQRERARNQSLFSWFKTKMIGFISTLASME